MYSVEYNGIFDHMYCTKPCILLNIQKIMLKYQFLAKVVCLIWFFTSHQQSFSYLGTGLPGLNQY